MLKTGGQSVEKFSEAEAIVETTADRGLAAECRESPSRDDNLMH
jgi:hypothetical protein